MVFVGVVVGALMTARRARLLDRMSLFWRAFVSVVQYAFVREVRSVREREREGERYRERKTEVTSPFSR